MNSLVLLNLSPEQISEKYVIIKYDRTIKFSKISDQLTERFRLPVRIYRIDTELRLVYPSVRSFNVSLYGERRNYPHYFLGFKFHEITENNSDQASSSLSDSNIEIISNFPPLDQLNKEDYTWLLILLNELENWDLTKPSARSLIQVTRLLSRWNLQSQLDKLQKDINHRLEFTKDIRQTLNLHNIEHTLSGLPDEIKINIISHMPINDIVSLSQVNKYYQNFILDPYIIRQKSADLNQSIEDINKSESFILDESLSLKDQWLSLVKYHDKYFYSPRCLGINDIDICIRLAIKDDKYEDFVQLYTKKYNEEFDDSIFYSVSVSYNRPSMIDFLLQLAEIDFSDMQSSLRDIVDLYRPEDDRSAYKIALRLVSMITNNPEHYIYYATNGYKLLRFFQAIYNSSIDRGWWDIALWAEHHDNNIALSAEHNIVMATMIKENSLDDDKNNFNINNIRRYLLKIAFRIDNRELFDWLLELDKNIDLTDSNLAQELLNDGITGNSIDLIQELLNRGLILNENISVYLYTNSNYKTLKFFLDKGLDPNKEIYVQIGSIKPIRHLSQFNINAEKICLLLSYGAHLHDIQNPERREYFREQCNPPTVPSLLQRAMQVIARNQIDTSILPPLLNLDPERQARWDQGQFSPPGEQDLAI